jgi:thioredoxin 1
MATIIRRQVVDTNDASLRRFTHEYPKVFAKFTADDCALCTELAPCFARLADDPANKDILFVRLLAAENPVA